MHCQDGLLIVKMPYKDEFTSILRRMACRTFAQNFVGKPLHSYPIAGHRQPEKSVDLPELSFKAFSDGCGE